MKLNHPVAMIFGAGATRGAFAKLAVPPPVDADFFELVARLKGHGTPRLARSVRRDVWALYSRSTDIGLESYYRDIETRATVLKFAKSANQPKNWQSRQRNLEELIRRTYIHTTCKTDVVPTRPHTSPAHDKVLRQLEAGDTVLTFNYDLVIEEALRANNLWSPRDGYGVAAHGITGDWCRRWRSPGGSAGLPKSKISLLKLHGSINWTLYNNNEIRIKPRPYVVRTRKGRPVFEDVSVLPPGWHKRIDRNPYKKLWRTARLRLEKCQTLVVVGYSLPETDLLARALVSEVVRLRAVRKSRLRQLHVADPSSVVKQRFVDMFMPALGSDGQVFRYADLDELADRFDKA
jgi:hypothetical protein